MNIIGSCDCGRQWSTHGEAHCASCHLQFSSDSAFDAHLAPAQSDLTCHPPESIVFGPHSQKAGEPKFELRQRASGPVWGLAGSRDWPFKPVGDDSQRVSGEKASPVASERM